MALTRVFVCLLMFGWGAEALHGGTIGVVISGAVALLINKVWHDQQRAERAERHRQQVIDDEDLRLEVRERREQP